MEDDEDCPELVEADVHKIPVTIITGYLGKNQLATYSKAEVLVLYLGHS